MKTDDARPLTKSCGIWTNIKHSTRKNYYPKEKLLDASEFLR